MTKIITIDAINQDIKIIVQNNALFKDIYVINKVSSQAELLVLSIEETLKKNNLTYDDTDVLSVVKGPGSFISIKTSISFAKAFKAITNKKIIENDVFEILSYNKKFDYVVVNGGINCFYIKDSNDNYSQQKKENFVNTLKNNDTVITNNQEIQDYVKDYCKVLNIKESIDDLIKLNHFKTEHKLFSEDIQPLYIGQPQINIKKN